jgi:cytochrome c oxidase subunit 3
VPGRRCNHLQVGDFSILSTRKSAVTQAVSAEVPAPQGKIVHDRPPMLAVGVMIWLGSEVMFFSGLFAAFFTIRANTVGPWPPAGTELDVVRAGIFTAILVASSFTMQYAVFQAEWRRRQSARIWVIATIVLGTAFLLNQVFEWLFLPTRWYTNSYGSLFYIMSGLHGLHVFIGLLAMVFFLGRMRGDKGGDPGELSAMQGISYYWHFVDIVWVGLYSCLFLLK